MPEEPDKVFYDWGKIVSESSESQKFYDESGKLIDGVFLLGNSENILSESHQYGAQVRKAKYSLILKEKQLKLLFNFEPVIVSLLIIVRFILGWNQSQVILLVLMLVCLIYMTYSMRLNVLQRLNNIKDAEYAGKDLFWKV